MDKKKEMTFNLNNFALAISPLLDFVEHEKFNTSMNHSKRVAFLALKLGIKLDLQPEQLSDLCSYALLHDMTLNISETLQEACEYAFEAVMLLPFLNADHTVIQYHKEFFNGRGIFGLKKEQIPLLSQIIAFAHTLDSIFDLSKPHIDNRVEIMNFVQTHHGELFNEEICDIFFKVSSQQSFWLDIQNENHILEFIYSTLDDFTNVLLFEQVLDICSVFTTIVDSNCKIIEKAALMCDYYQFEHKDKFTFMIAASLENIGKFRIPNAILQKDSILSTNELEEVKSYPYHTKKILNSVMGFSDITSWASKSHECLDGTGYPYRIEASALSLKDRLMANLVIYESLRNKKSYRDAFSHANAIRIMNEMAYHYKIDKTIVEDINKVFEAI